MEWLKYSNVDLLYIMLLSFNNFQREAHGWNSFPAKF
jgi:hypothetical protein